LPHALVQSSAPATPHPHTLLPLPAVLYVIPCMCPDGAWRGHLRTNANGVNLNRAWTDPSEADAPEVFHTLRKMDEIGERGGAAPGTCHPRACLCYLLLPHCAMG
jgi:murein tripeptide amidase MpaA